MDDTESGPVFLVLVFVQSRAVIVAVFMLEHGMVSEAIPLAWY